MDGACWVCFLLLPFTCWGYEYQDLFESLQWNACVHRVDLGLYSHRKEFWGSGVRNHVILREKSPLPENQRRVEPLTLHHAVQQAQHTTDKTILVIVADWFWWPDHLVGLVVKASASRAEDPGFESRDFSGVESYQWLENWHSSGYPARHLAL